MSSSLRSFRLSHVCDVLEVNKLFRFCFRTGRARFTKSGQSHPTNEKSPRLSPVPELTQHCKATDVLTMQCGTSGGSEGCRGEPFFVGRAGLVMTLLTANDLCGSKSQRVYSPCRALPVGPTKRSERAALPNRSDRMRDNTVGLCCGMKKLGLSRFSD